MIARKDVLSCILSQLTSECLIVASGMLSREVFAMRHRPLNFYMLGSMGLASAIALGIAAVDKTRRVCVLDGDGNLLLGLATVPMVAQLAPENFTHFVIDNESYASTGGQASASREVALDSIALAAGYRSVYRVGSKAELEASSTRALAEIGPTLLLAKTRPGVTGNVPRVALTPRQIRCAFCDALQDMGSRR